MPALFFTNAWMLAGLAALSVPVLIHLLLRRKKKRLRFSTLQFFLRQDEQSSQRRKLRNWLLLALRLLICTLLVLAFARPYLEDQNAVAGKPPRQVVVVLDRSLSMQANANDGPKWLRARESVRQVLSELKGNDRAALVSCGVRAEVLSEWAPAAVVAKALTDLQPTCGAASLSEGLKQATRLLSIADPKAASSVYMISDFQRRGCENLSSSPLPLRAELKLLPVGDLVTPNLAITDLQVEGQQARVSLTSFSDENINDLKLEWSVDGKPCSTGLIALSAGASTNLETSLPALTPGWHDITARLNVRDALGADNARFETILVPEPAHGLVVEPRPSQRAFEEETFFAVSALNPAAEGTNSLQNRFALKRVSADDLAGALGKSPAKAGCDLVVLPGLKQFPSALPSALRSYLQAGGGVLMFLGEGVSANRYNAELRGILPVQLDGVETSLSFENAWRIGEHDTNHASFAAFQGPNSGDVSLPRFYKRFRLTSVDAKGVVARYRDGTPLMVQTNIGRGRLVLVNTSADTAWNDWPKHKTYVPWMHGLGEFVAGSTEDRKGSIQPKWVAGSDSDVELGTESANAEVTLREPGGKERTFQADPRGQVRDVTMAAPGVYTVRTSTGAELRRLAVNVPPQESDLTALPPDHVQQQVARLPEERHDTLAAGLFGSGSNHREMWRVLLIAALVLLAVELVVANRTLA